MRNKTPHSAPSILRDTYAEKTWHGPLVVTMREGSAFDPPLVKDVDLMAYRYALDFLGYYRDGYASMIEGWGKEGHLARLPQKRWILACQLSRFLLGLEVAADVVLPPIAVKSTPPLFLEQNYHIVSGREQYCRLAEEIVRFRLQPR